MVRYWRVLVCLCLHIMATPLFADDLWSTLRAQFNIPIPYQNKQIKQQINWIKAHPTYLRSFVENSRPYIHAILMEIKIRDLPGELSLLPMIESNYNPYAYSRAGASGLWQLMPGTSSGLGLKQTKHYDGRRSILKSTGAALEYLTYLAKFFDNDWLLAIAAYDSGEGTVLKALRYNKAHHRPVDFWSLHLPRETQAYLPRLLALAAVIRYPSYYHIKLPKASINAYFEEVPLDIPLSLLEISKITHSKYSDLLKLNPGHSLMKDGKHQKTSILIPLAYVAALKEKLKRYKKHPHAYHTDYYVKSGDTLSVIALRFKTKVRNIMQLNHLSSSTIKVGQHLYLKKPMHNKISKEALKLIRKLRLAQQKKVKVGPKKIVHFVKSGDSYSKLEKHYHVKAAAIRFWNQLTPNHKLKINEKLVIWVTPQKIKRKHKVYLVKSGDTLSTIALRFHTTVKKIKQWNGRAFKNSNIIKPRQHLVLYV